VRVSAAFGLLEETRSHTLRGSTLDGLVFHTAFHTRAARQCFWGLQDSVSPCEKTPRLRVRIAGT